MGLAVGQYVVNFWQGCLDSLHLSQTFYFLFHSPELRRLFWKFFLLNGLIICGSLLFFQYVGHHITLLLHRLSSGDPWVTPVFVTGFTILFKYAWIWPVRILAHVFNCVWSIRVFDEANKVRKQKQFTGALSGYDRLLRYLTEYIYQLVLVFFFFCEANMWAFIPYGVGTLMSAVFFAWLHAFYVFDYRWAYEGKSLRLRVKAFELSWDYYLGFGAPMTMLYFLLCQIPEDGPFIAFGVTSFLFPIHVVLTLCLTPRPSAHGTRMNIFSHFAMKGVDVLWHLSTTGGP